MPEPEKHIIICGYPRSGTSLFYGMMIAGIPNFEHFPNELMADKRLPIKERSITKRPKDIFGIDNIARYAIKMQKDIRIIVLTRDPRAALTSKHGAVPGQYFIGYDQSFFLPQTGIPSFSDPGLLAYIDAVERVRQRTDVPVLMLRYEDLIANPDNCRRQLSTFIDEPIGDDFLRADTTQFAAGLKLALNGERQLDPSRIEGWRHPDHRMRILSQFANAPELQDILVRFGYEINDSWLTELRHALSPAQGQVMAIDSAAPVARQILSCQSERHNSTVYAVDAPLLTDADWLYLSALDCDFAVHVRTDGSIDPAFLYTNGTEAALAFARISVESVEGDFPSDFKHWQSAADKAGWKIGHLPPHFYPSNPHR